MANPLAKDETEFVRAIEDYKKQKGKLFLSWTEVLAIVKDLGYVQSAQRKKTPAAAGTKKSKKASAKKGPKKAAAAQSTEDTSTKTPEKKTTA